VVGVTNTSSRPGPKIFVTTENKSPVVAKKGPFSATTKLTLNSWILAPQSAVKYCFSKTGFNYGCNQSVDRNRNGCFTLQSGLGPGQYGPTEPATADRCSAVSRLSEDLSGDG